VNIYSALLWMAMLAMTLLRLPRLQDDFSREEHPNKPDLSIRSEAVLNSGAKEELPSRQ
jgi:hypothetical protein